VSLRCGKKGGKKKRKGEDECSLPNEGGELGAEEQDGEGKKREGRWTHFRVIVGKREKGEKWGEGRFAHVVA